MNLPGPAEGTGETNRSQLPKPGVAVWIATAIILLLASWFVAGLVVGMYGKLLYLAGLREQGRKLFLPVKLVDDELAALITLGICALLVGAQLWAVLGRSTGISFLIGWTCLSLTLLFILLFLWTVIMMITGMTGADKPETIRNPWPWSFPIILGFIGTTMLKWRNKIRRARRRSSTS